MAIQGLTQTQSDFIKTYVLVPKGFGRKKKAKARRETAVKEFRRFNVNRDAVAGRIDQIPDAAARKLLQGELAKAEALIGEDAKTLDFDAAMAKLVDVNKAVSDHIRQAEVKEKYTRAVRQMDVVKNGPPLDNIDDIELVWTYAENTYEHGIRSNDQKALTAADKSFDQLFDLIRAGREDIRGEGREAKRKLRDVEIVLQELEETLNTVFTVAHVPPPITALLKTVHDRLEGGENATLAALPGAATAAETAFKAAESAGNKIIAEKKKWEDDNQRFRLRYAVLNSHKLHSETDFVAPKFKQVTDAYAVAGGQAIKHEYARASTSLAPIFARLEAALTFADDYQNFLSVLEKRRVLIDALPAAAGRNYDQVKNAITAVRKLLTDAIALRDGGNMDTALGKLNDIKRDAPAAEQLIKYEDEFDEDHPMLAEWPPVFESNVEIAALMPTEIALIKKTITDAKAKADGGYRWRL